MRACAPVISRKPFTDEERKEASDFVLKMQVKGFVSSENSEKKLRNLGVKWESSDNLAVNSRRMSLGLIDAIKSGDVKLSDLN